MGDCHKFHSRTNTLAVSILGSAYLSISCYFCHYYMGHKFCAAFHMRRCFPPRCVAADPRKCWPFNNLAHKWWEALVADDSLFKSALLFSWLLRYGTVDLCNSTGHSGVATAAAQSRQRRKKQGKAALQCGRLSPAALLSRLLIFSWHGETITKVEWFQI